MRFSAFLIALFLFTTPAKATPPQVVSVDETLFGIGGPFLFIMRELNDNLGSHTQQQTDVLLIARNIMTNQDIYVWPIKRTLDNGPDHLETSDAPRVVSFPLGWENIPEQILFFHRGNLANERKATDADRVNLLKNKDGVLITIRTPDFAYEPPKDTPLRTSYWVSYSDLAELFRSSLLETRLSLPPLYLEGTDHLKNVRFNPELNCSFDYFVELSVQTDGPQQGFWAANITCENDLTMAPVSMLFTLRSLD